LTISHEGKSRNATQNRSEKYNMYLTNSGQNAAFFTFFETTRVLAISAGRRYSTNRKRF
jgi:hypothetical protein